jgi:hypothetical protein
LDDKERGPEGGIELGQGGQVEECIRPHPDGNVRKPASVFIKKLKPMEDEKGRLTYVYDPNAGSREPSVPVSGL